MRHASFATCLSFSVALALPYDARAYELIGAAWDADKGPVPFHLEPSGSDDIPDESELAAVRSAFRTWSCVEGSRLRLVEGEQAGAKEAEAFDGINSVFWDEDGTFGLGPATLGVTYGPAPTEEGQTVERTWATIVFNGLDHSWSTTDNPGDASVDVESIALHEAGHWLGLEHPCDDPSESACLGPDEAVMTPVYPGGLLREPRDDDEEGVRALYPQDDDSTCEGPYRQGERCGCNDDCIAALLCVDAPGGAICAPACSSDDVSCPTGFVCVLAPRPAGGSSAPGSCRQLDGEGQRPPGALCERDDDCAEGLCATATAVGRTVCRVRCAGDDECGDGYACVDEVCLAGAVDEGIPCGDDVEPPACGCRAPSHGAPRGSLWLGLAVVVLFGGRGARPGKRPRRRGAKAVWGRVEPPSDRTCAGTRPACQEDEATS